MLAGLAVLAGCALPPEQHASAGTELVRVASSVLDTAWGTDDARAVLRRELGAGPRDRMVLVAGHRFLIVPATVDRLGRRPSEPAGYLVAQSLELAEQACLPMGPVQAGWEAKDAGNGRSVHGASASAVQFVSVAIELQKGCIVALHVEQAGGLPR